MSFAEKSQVRLFATFILFCMLIGGVTVHGHMVNNSLYLPMITMQKEPTVDLPLLFYDPLVLKYNPNKWRVTLDQYERDMLTHISISDCEILEQGPTMFPPSLEPVQVGKITYLVSENVITSVNIVYRAYLVNENVPGWTDPDTWVFLVTENKVGDVTCENDQRDVLATLGIP